MPAPYEGLGVFYLGRSVDPVTSEVGTAPVLHDAADLTTHAFIVGMTGSGKTGLGAFLGGGRRRSTLSQVGVTARSAGRASKERSDVRRAEEKRDALQAEYADLDAELTREMEAIDLTLAPETAPLDTVEIAPRQTDMAVTEIALAWVPFARDADGRLTRSLP